MSQLKQTQKVKLFRILKVVFYMLGLPLFFIAVFFTAIKFIGVEPFVGLSTSTFASGIFVGFERFITSPALYGIWCAFAIWAFISICHIVLSKFVKNGKVRMFAVIAIILVVMLGTMGIMDAAFQSQIGKIADGAPTGVTVQDYKSQLSYYDYVSYGRKDKSLINQLTDKVAQYEDVYNIKWQGIDKSGEAGNIANKPVTYAEIIAPTDTPEGEHMIGAQPESANIAPTSIVEKAPNADGILVLKDSNGEERQYTNYYYITRTASNGTKCYMWYSRELVPVGYKWDAKSGKMTYNLQDGIYGKGLYNENGMLSDGWVFSFENMLEILEDYYAGQDYLAKNADNVLQQELVQKAWELRDAYYKSDDDTTDYVQALYTQEQDFAKKFSLDGRLDEVIAKLGEFLGDNALFDWLFNTLSQNSTFPLLAGMLGGMIPVPGMGDVLGKWFPAFTKTGATLSDLLTYLRLSDYSEKIMSAIQNAYNTNHDADETVADVFLKLTYKDGTLYLEMRNGNAEGTMLADAVIDQSMDLSTLGPFLSHLLDALVDELGLKEILDLVGGLAFQNVTIDGVNYKGINIAGTTVPLMNATTGKFAIDVEAILVNILNGLYSYQSPVIKPVWEFYEKAAETLYEGDAEKLEFATYLADYERANYEATVYGGMIGSTLVGDTLGAGTYPAALGLTDLASVQQLKTDLSYQPKNFPLYAFRDMLLTFAGIVMFFYFLSFVAAEKERKYAALECGECETATCGEKKSNAFTGALGKVCNAAKATSKKASLGRKITSYVLYALAFLPLLIVGIVMAAKSAAILPQYGAMHFIGFIILLVLAIVYAVVVILLTRKSSKSSATSKTIRIGITYVCVTAVLALLCTYVLPDLVADATSSTMWVEDMFNDPLTQVEENAALEHDYVRNNLLNGNLNLYNEDGTINKDFSYYGLKQKGTVDGKKNQYLNEYVRMKYEEYNKNGKVDEILGTLDAKHLELYNYIYNNYVLLDPDYAFNSDSSEQIARRALTLAMTEYLFDNGYEEFLNEGLKGAKLAQLFANNYDSFNQDGYKPLDDSLLLYAQLDGRMTVPVIVRLILNKGWTYSQPQVDETDGHIYYDENNSFLYEMYDPEARDAFVNEEKGAFDTPGELVNGDGSKYTVNFGVNKDGWKIYENGVVRRPVKWLVLDMLGTPMDLATLDISNYQQILIFLSSPNLNTYEKLSEFLGEDVKGLVGELTDGAGLFIGAYFNDAGELELKLLPMSTTYGMLGYMQATWIQSNGLLMAVINVMALRNYLYIFAGIGLLLILLAGVAVDLEKKYGTAPAEASSDAPEEGEAPAEEAAPETADAAPEA